MIEEILQKIEQLPPIPNVVTELQNLYYSDMYNASDIEQVINKDPNLVVDILKTANSPYYGFPREIHDIRQAVVLFGLDQIIEFALASTVEHMLQFNLDFYGINANQFMKMSVLKSNIAKELVPVKKDKFLVATTAFLCDVSKIVLSNYALEHKIEPISDPERLNVLDTIEKERIGDDSIEVAVVMFEKWNFSVEMITLLKQFKTGQKTNERALFVARDIVKIDGTVDKEYAQTLLEYSKIQKVLA
ncbi:MULTISPECIES: HDOD domain-containing protein [unclassified Nitratiruptor]|uniref:HDOD domain-containing protein n=1 Tax=unclassified Nitratiruptor TaxID=2624044 RepID=UPI001915F916|nr:MULTISPECIES: HDOD domain-containing protein [unclassified Nitratiruptor]BCD60419.1 hypothetical protein NitYY0810_C1184 [Nitratiruptor sp. YY08-10]BCD64092.1 hypothetical protein NitYY0814_C0937 [Nitratiruptor sp. YY08-14]